MKKYPNLVQKFTYGTSFTGDNPLIAMCLTADAKSSCQLTPNVDKPRFLVMTQIHAREIATSEMAWRFMTRLIDGYKKDAQITSLLQEQRDLGGAGGQPGRHRDDPGRHHPARHR